MGTHFVGSTDYTLATAQSVTSGAPFTGAFFEVLEAEIHELEAILADLSAEATLLVIIEADLGIVDDSQVVATLATLTFETNETQLYDIPLGGLPGGRRIRIRSTNDGAAATLNATLREGRSGLLNA